MSYENDDMIENSDRGYEMNLDRVMQDMYQKKEVKKDEDYLKLDSNIPMKTLIQEDIKNSDNDFIISTLNSYKSISRDKYIQKLSLRCTKSHTLNKLFLCQIKEHLYRKRMSKILTIHTQDYMGWVDKFQLYFKDTQDDDIKTLLGTYTKGVLKLKNDFENIDDYLEVTPIEYRNYIKRLNALSDMCNNLHSIYKVYKED